MPLVGEYPLCLHCYFINISRKTPSMDSLTSFSSVPFSPIIIAEDLITSKTAGFMGDYDLQTCKAAHLS